MTKICFVCLGNICRSTMAEAVMKAMTTEMEIESRGTSGWENGNPIHSGTQRMLLQHEIPFDKAKGSQQISGKDFAYFDYIIGMDEQNIRDLHRMAPNEYTHKIHPFEEKSVPDPYYTGDFESTYRQITRGCQLWLETLNLGD